MHTSTSNKMIAEFFESHAKSFKYTGGDLMKTFLGMEVEQERGEIHLHLDTYVQEMLTKYQAYIKKDVKLKKILMQPGVPLTNDDRPEIPDPLEQRMYQPFGVKDANWGNKVSLWSTTRLLARYIKYSMLWRS